MSADTTTGFDFTATYREPGGGIAWRVTGYAQEWTEETYEYLGEPEGYEPETYYEETGYYTPDEDPANYLVNEPEQVEDRSRVVAHMIGDDRDFTFDIDDLEPIARDDYCGECGQIGCVHDGYDREED